MLNYGVYIHDNDAQVWILENVTNREAAALAEEVNAQLGVRTLVLGPLTVFPKFVETKRQRAILLRLC
jgi:hypothetical protein